MTSTNTTFAQRLDILKKAEVKGTLPGIKHGVEREALRINANGSLAQTPHPDKLGSALTHDSITTDYSESLLEFITPPEKSPKKTLAQLRDIHKYVIANIGDERLWPMSMPCYVNDEGQIPIAEYGSSNVGKMKTLYRVGLKNRYGSMMQAIAGVHFNFSLPNEFWQHWLEQAEQTEAGKDSVSAAYFSLIRNYRRFCWMIPYLFGASPALCGSFIKDKPSPLKFEKLGEGTFYLPYATSLRMSDLGYTNSTQSDLAICYNKVETYIDSLRGAINTPSADYKKFAGKVNGEYQQLNGNVLQIENELYSPIRPKQPTRSLEKPTDALADRGVSYIEVRALDVDPFSDVGISEQHFYFLDVFLLYCVVAPSELMDRDSYQQTEDNLGAVVLQGRDPELRLQNGDRALSIPQWAGELFEQFKEVAKVLDEANDTSAYSDAIEAQWLKVESPDETPSGRWLNHLLANQQDNGRYGVELAEQYRSELLTQGYELSDEVALEKLAQDSIQAQADIENSDKVSFDEFLRDYFVETQEKLAKQSIA